MFSQQIRHVMDPEGLVLVAPESLVHDAARLMAERHVSAALVVQDNQIKGIFSADDALHRVLAQGRDASSTPIAEVMSTPVFTAQSDWTLGRALQLMHAKSLRQLPVLEDGLPVGMLSSRDALDPELEEFTCEAHRREGYTHEPPPRTKPRAIT